MDSVSDVMIKSQTAFLERQLAHLQETLEELQSLNRQALDERYRYLLNELDSPDEAIACLSEYIAGQADGGPVPLLEKELQQASHHPVL